MEHNADELLAAIASEGSLEALAAEQPEGQFLDFKAAPPPITADKEVRKQWRESIAKAICAFANAAGGIVVVGVSDSPRTLKPFEHPTRVAEELSRQLTTQIEPYPIGIRVDPIPTTQAGHGYLRLFAPESLEAPHMFKGVFYRRRGEESVPMTRSEIADMFGRRLKPSFRFGVVGYLTQDSSPRYIFKVSLKNRGGGSAVAPAVQIAPIGSQLTWRVRGTDFPDAPWVRNIGQQLKILRAETGFMLHPDQEERALTWEVSTSDATELPWSLLLRVYCADNKPQETAIRIDGDMLAKLQSQPNSDVMLTEV